MSTLNSLGGLSSLRGLSGGGQVRQGLPQDFDPFEERGAIRKFLNIAFTPISALLDVLDTPAGLTRDLLSGESLSEASEGILNPSERATGRDVLSNLFGETPESERFTIKGFDVGSALASVVTDPLLFTGSVTGFTKAGQAAKKLAVAELERNVARSQLKGLVGKTRKFEASREGVRRGGVAAPGIRGAGDPERQVVRGLETGEEVGVLHTEITNRLGLAESTIKQLKAAGTQQLTGSVKGDVAAGLRGISASVPFGKHIGVGGEIVFTPVNKLLAPLFEAGAKIKGFLSDTAIVNSIRNTFQAAPKTELGKVLKLTDESNQQAAKIANLERRPTIIENIKDAAKSEGISVAALKDGTGQIPGINAVVQMDQVFPRIDEQVKIQLAEFDAEATKTIILNKGYNLTSTELEEVEKFALNRARARKNNLIERAEVRKAEIVRESGWVNSRGEMTRELIEEFSVSGQNALDIQKAQGVTIRKLEVWESAYVPRLTTPQGLALYKSNPKLKTEVDSMISDQLGHTKARGEGLKHKTHQEFNAVMRKRLGIDFDILKTDPVELLEANRINAAHSVSNALNVTAALKIGGVRSNNLMPKHVAIEDVLHESGITNWLTDGKRLAEWEVGATKNKILEALNAVGDNDIQIPLDLAQDILRSRNMSKIVLGSTERALRIMDPINTIYRTLLTSNPAHMGTNIMGFMWANLYAGVHNPRTYFGVAKEALRSFLRNNPNSFTGKRVWGKLIDKNKTTEYTQLFNEYQKTSLAKLGATEFKDLAVQVENLGRRGRGGVTEVVQGVANKVTRGRTQISPTTGEVEQLGGTRIGSLFAGTRRANEFLDEVARATHYIEKRLAGDTSLMAQASAKKYLFDYTELTPFERKVGQRGVLFYTFMRKNLEFSLREVFINRSVRAVAQASRDSLALQGGERGVPEFIREVGSLGLEPGTFIDTKNPIFEANKFSPQGGGLTRVADRFATILTPTIKVPLELATGREFFRGRPLSEVNRTRSEIAEFFAGTGLVERIQTADGEELRIQPQLAAIVRSLPTSRFTQIASDLTNEQISTLPSLFGARTRKFDPEVVKAKAFRAELIELAKEKPEIRGFTRFFGTAEDPTTGTQAILDALRSSNKTFTELSDKRAKGL